MLAFVCFGSVFSIKIFPKFVISYGITILCLIFYLHGKKLEVAKNYLGLGLLILLCSIVALLRSVNFFAGAYQYYLYFLTFAIVAILIPLFPFEWEKTVYATLYVLIAVYAIGNLYFYFSPSAYTQYAAKNYPQAFSILMRNYGYGYMSGFFDHYSTNGMMLATGVGLYFVYSLIEVDNEKKREIFFQRFMFIVTLISLLLTAKRGPLLFAAVACVMVLIIKNGKHIGKSLGLLAIVIVILYFGYQYLIEYIPDLGNVFLRFENMTDADGFSGRTRLWAKAFELFKTSPIFGIGWGNFKVMAGFEEGINAHNIYIQLLCETGIVGISLFTAYFIGMFALMLSVVEKVRSMGRKNGIIQRRVYFSLFSQLFFLMYGMSGNTLYDTNMLFLYSFSCWIAIYYANYFQSNMKIGDSEK